MVAFCRLTAIIFAVAASAHALSSALVPITDDFGANPTGVSMYIYKPTRLAHPTPLIVAMHYCRGTAQKYFEPPNLARLADQHGFMLIYPSAPASNGCWDVHTNGSLTHDGGGDSLAIANVVRWAIRTQGVDRERVYSAGTSSGAMMTNVLLGAYPDLFKAGSVFSGVPYACFAGPNAWNAQCAQGELVLTPKEWGDRVRSAYPGYVGLRPKVQFWYGAEDSILSPQNFWEEIKQWTNVFGVGQTPVWNITGHPLEDGYSRASYGPNIQAILVQGVGHAVPEHWQEAVEWFGLSCLTPAPDCPAHCIGKNEGIDVDLGFAYQPQKVINAVPTNFMDEL